MRQVIVAALFVMSIGCLAQADMGLTGVGGYLSSPGGGVACTGGYTGVGDIQTGANVYLGLRAYNSTSCLLKAINIVRASDSHTCDVLTAITGGLGNTANCSSGADNGISASSFCNATTCTASKVYDQTGNGNNVTQSTVANQPTLTFNCINTNLPCLTANGTTDIMNASSCNLATMPATWGGFGERTGNVTSFSGIYSICQSSSAHWFNLANKVDCGFDGGSNIGATTANDNVWHSLVCGAPASAGGTADFVIDGTDNTWAGGTTGSLNSGSSSFVPNPFAGNVTEVMVWGAKLTAATMQSVCHNESLFYGTPSC